MYDLDAGTVNKALQDASLTIFSDATIAHILALTTSTNDTKVTFTNASHDVNGIVTVAAGSEVVLVQSSHTSQTTVKPPANAPVVIFQGRGGVVATFNDGGTVPGGNQSDAADRVIVGTAGADRIIVADAKDTRVVLGSGNSTVQAGLGVDTIEAGLGNSTITGGSGGDYAVVKLAGAPNNYTVTTSNGHAIVTHNDTGKTTDISKIQFVQLDDAKALVFAKNSAEGEVATLYHTAFGRYADAGGLDYFYDGVRAGWRLIDIATIFVHSSEFASVHPSTETNTAFVQSLYKNTFNRAGEDIGVAHWLSLMASGTTKADILTSFAQIAIQNVMHEAPNQEAQIVGNTSIVTGIV